MKPIAHIDANFVAPVMKFAAVNDVRYYIKGMHNKPAAAGGVLVMATDGHTAIIARDPSGWCREPMTIRPEAKLKEAAQKAKARTLMVYPNGVGLVRDYTAERWMTMQDGLDDSRAVGKVDFIDHSEHPFPNIVDRFPDEVPMERASFSVNPKYLGRFERCFGDMMGMGGGRGGVVWNGVSIHAKHADDAILVLPTVDLDAAGLVMPIRVDVQEYTKEWMKPATKKRMRVARDGSLVPVDEPKE